VAVRPGHRLVEQTTCSLIDLDDIRVLVHAREQVPGEHDRMITIANELGITPHWLSPGSARTRYSAPKPPAPMPCC
jgi:hypothetical protein